MGTLEFESRSVHSHSTEDVKQDNHKPLNSSVGVSSISSSGTKIYVLEFTEQTSVGVGFLVSVLVVHCVQYRSTSKVDQGSSGT